MGAEVQTTEAEQTGKIVEDDELNGHEEVDHQQHETLGIIETETWIDDDWLCIHLLFRVVLGSF